MVEVGDAVRWATGTASCIRDTDGRDDDAQRAPTDGELDGLDRAQEVLRAASVASGTTLDLTVEDGRIVASPVRDHPRAGWAEAAAPIAADPEPPMKRRGAASPMRMTPT